MYKICLNRMKDKNNEPVNFTLGNFFKVIHELFARSSEIEDIIVILVHKLSWTFDRSPENGIKVVQYTTTIEAQSGKFLLPWRMGVSPNYGSQKLVLQLDYFEVVVSFAVHHKLALVGSTSHCDFQVTHRRANSFFRRQKCAVQSSRSNR